MAINFKLMDVFKLDAEDDPMNREWVGYHPSYPPEVLFAQNRGVWHLGERAEEEEYLTFSYDGEIVLVAQIDGIEALGWANPKGRRDKKAVIGRVLGPGNRAHDYFIGRPVDGHRNPVTYIDDPDSRPGPAVRVCACGCGRTVSGARHFVSGHDQKAVHERIGRQWGDTRGFIEWFDATYPRRRGGAQRHGPASP